MTESDGEITLKEFVAATQEVFRICHWEAEDPNGVDFPSLYLHRHMIHMADGIEVLSSASAVVATFPLLRSMLEALIALEYINKKDYEQRSRSWLFQHQKQEIKKAEMIDGDTESGRDFRRLLESELPNLTLPPFDSRTPTEDARAFLREPDMVPIVEEFEKFKKEHKNKPPAWYQMFEGADNRYCMAKEVGLAATYRLLYGPWSNTIHAMDPNTIISLPEEDAAEFRDLRDPHYLEFTKDAVLVLLSRGTRIVVARFVPEEKIARLNISLTS